MTLPDEKVDRVEKLLAQQFKEATELIEAMAKVFAGADADGPTTSQIAIGTAYMSGVGHGLNIAENDKVATAVRQVLAERVLQETGGDQGLHFAGIKAFMHEVEKVLREGIH